MKKITFNNRKELSYGKREALNTLRTNLSFCGADIKVILFTSSNPDEGKSTTVIELARSFASDGRKIIVLDCDLRKSVFESRYHITQAKGDNKEILGITHYLTGKCGISDIICRNEEEGFDIVLAGRSTPSPTELLNSELFSQLVAYCRENYEVVLIDSPPIGSVIDSAVIAPKTDGIVYVIEHGTTRRSDVIAGRKQLELTGVRILGAVLSKVNNEKGGIGYKSYSNYGYYRHDDSE